MLIKRQNFYSRWFEWVNVPLMFIWTKILCGASIAWLRYFIKLFHLIKRKSNFSHYNIQTLKHYNRWNIISSKSISTPLSIHTRGKVRNKHSKCHKFHIAAIQLHSRLSRLVVEIKSQTHFIQKSYSNSKIESVALIYYLSQK